MHQQSGLVYKPHYDVIQLIKIPREQLEDRQLTSVDSLDSTTVEWRKRSRNEPKISELMSITLFESWFILVKLNLPIVDMVADGQFDKLRGVQELT